MADVWDVGVASIDIAGNLSLDGGISYSADSSVMVANSSTDTGRYSNLVSAYLEAKSLTPGGNALSISNRAVVMIPPGIYDGETTNSLVLDTSFIDLVATASSIPNTNMDVIDPPSTRIIGALTAEAAAANNALVGIKADNIRIIGLSIENNGIGNPLFMFETDGSPNNYYENLYLIYNPTPEFGSWSQESYGGTWVNVVSPCTAAFRMSGGYNWGINKDRWFTATMINCHARDYSFGGDYVGAEEPETIHEFSGAKFYNCSAWEASFGGCVSFGIASDADTLFYECSILSGKTATPEDGGHSFSLGEQCAATFIRCKGGSYCGGATWLVGNPGEFSGYAEGCDFGEGSLGGRSEAAEVGGVGKFTGEIVRCQIRDNVAPHNIEGAIIDNSIISNVTANSDGIKILDSASVIRGSTILVNGTGTGVPINAASALNVVAVGCIFNNGDNDADGLGANVTNLATTAGNALY